MARKDERIELPDEVLEKEVLSWDEWVQIYLEVYKDLTGEDYPHPIANMEEWKKLQKIVRELERELEEKEEKESANKRKRKGKKSK